MSAEHRDGDVERGPTAALDFSLPAPLLAACPDLLGRYVKAGYKLFTFAERPAPLRDPLAACTPAAAKPKTGDSPNVVVIMYPVGTRPGHPADGVSVILTPGRRGDAHPHGTHLRLTAG